jgi:hypothetical protein
MGYTTQEGMVRVDRFKERGKWYDSLAFDDLKAMYEDILKKRNEAK